MPAQQVAKSLNGVDVNRLIETIDEIRTNPDLAISNPVDVQVKVDKG